MMHATNAVRAVRTAQMVLTQGGIDRPPFMGMGRRFLRAVTCVIVGTMLNMSLLPLVQAMQQQRQQEQMRAATNPVTAIGRYAQALEALNQTATAQLKSKTAPAQPGGNGLGDIATIESYADGVRAEWAQLRAKWQTAKVPQEIIDRQLKIEAGFETGHRALMALLQQPDSPQKTQSLADFLTRNLPKPAHVPIDFNHMPWQVQKPVKTEPADTPEALQQKLNLTVPASAKAAATTTFHVKDIPLPTAADLAATLDAQQSDDIKQLAQSLGNDPLKIYKWVHDNIAYFPSQGSVQGAQDTLDKKSGNAVDTASLLIALLRSANIPAHYVYGTVEIPIDQAMNWVGGAKTADAAQQMLGQGGVPNVALTSGGKVVTMRMEHVWVEAFIQYNPGRGARHIQGTSTPDTWVPMDGSFKQYTFSQGMDLQSAVPLDANALITAAQQGATVNEQEGWVRNLNTTAVQTQLTNYQNQLKTYIDNQNGGNSTVGDVLGTRTAKIDPLPYFAGTLPYTVRARTQAFSEVPDNLRVKFSYAIYPDQTSAAWGDSPIVQYQAPTATLAGKKVTLAWVAATAADEAAIEALIPTPPPGQELDPSQLPTGLPAVGLKPEIRVDGVTVASGSGLSAGSEPIGVGGFTQYGSQQWDTSQDQLIAGQQTAIGMSVQGISQKQIETLKTRMEATKATLQQAQAAPQDQRAAILQGMTGENITGDTLTATIWGYFVNLQSHGSVASVQAQMFDMPALSYGLFHAQVKPRKLYGIVTTGLTFQGLNMDIGHLRHFRWVKDDDPQSPINNKPELTANGKSAAQNRWITYNKMRGQYSSAMESVTPEQFWIDKSTCRYTDEQGQIQNPALADCQQAISAVKAIAIAQSQGQKIYTITPQNRATALPTITGANSEIISAINAGKEVTFHESPINAYGWSGAGYSIVDPETGAGSYLIEGNGNGGWLGLANQYLALYGVGAWDKIRADRSVIERATGAVDTTYREAEHFLYALIYMSPEDGWLVTAISTEGYWVVKAVSNIIFQSYSPWQGSPVSWDELIAGLYGNYCATFGCFGTGPY